MGFWGRLFGRKDVETPAARVATWASAPAPREVKAGEVIAPSALDAGTLFAIFQAAGWGTQMDSDGDVHVKDGGGLGFYLMPRDGRVRMLSIFSLERGAGDDQVLRAISKVNLEYTMIRCTFVAAKRKVMVDYDLFVGDGVPPETIVACAKQFALITAAGLREHAWDYIQ